MMGMLSGVLHFAVCLHFRMGGLERAQKRKEKLSFYPDANLS